MTAVSSPSSLLEEKRAVLRVLRDRLKLEVASLTAAQKDAQAAATHEEAKPENDKDTRALEASYLARGQAERVKALEKDSNTLEFMELHVFKDDEPIALGALVDAEIDGEPVRYFLTPCSGGERVDAIQVVTPLSPIGKALVGKSPGDAFEVKVAAKAREIAILAVR